MATPEVELSDVNAGPFMRLLGLRITELTPDRVSAEWEVTPQLHQPHGIVHGGVHCSVVESLASVAASVWFEAQGTEGRVVGVNNNTDFFRAVRDGVLHSTATPLHRGRSQQVWIVETLDDEGRLVSRGQVRLQNLTATPPV